MLLFHFFLSILRHCCYESRSTTSGHSTSRSTSARWSSSAWWSTSPWCCPKGILLFLLHFVSCTWSNWRTCTPLSLKFFDKILDRFFILAINKNLFLILLLPNRLGQSAHERFIICRLAILELFKYSLFYPYGYFDYLAHEI